MINEEIWPEPKERENNMTIEERLENMERELGRQKRRNRWLLGAIIVLLGGLVAAGAFKTTVTTAQAQGAGTAKLISANNFFLIDENGRPRAALFVGKDGPSLSLSDENGKTRVWLRADKDGVGLGLYDENGKNRARLWADKDGPVLALRDENDKNRALLVAGKDGPSLSLGDENGKIRAGLATLKDSPTLVLFDENGQGRFMAGKAKIITPDGKTIEYPESSLILFGPDGKVIWSAKK